MDTKPANFSAKDMYDYATLEYILVGDLRDVLEEPAEEETRMWLLAILDALLDILVREFDLSEDGGYLAEVLEEYPNWYIHVERLHRQHDDLCANLKELRDRVSRRVAFADIASDLSRDLHDWMNSLTAHHRHETRIVQEAMNLEVGTGD